MSHKFLVAGITFLFILSSVQTSFCQDYRWKLTLADGKTISEVALDSRSGDSLIVKRDDSTFAVEVGQIHEVRLVRKSNVKQGAIIGAAVGLLAGAVYYLKTYEEPPNTLLPGVGAKKTVGTINSSVEGGLIGTAVGATVGALWGSDEVYNLSQIGLKGKLTAIDWILSHRWQRQLAE